MSLFDGILRDVLGGDAQNGAGSGSGIQLQAILQWVEEQGGFAVLLEKFQQGGLGGILNSWIGTGGNEAIGSGEVQSAFGNDALQSLADKLGTDVNGASSALAQYLPGVVDKASPAGEIDTQSVSSLLGNVFGKS